jgi:hypothetical protein
MTQDSEECGARQPGTGLQYECTLLPHPEGTDHVASDTSDRVVATWPWNAPRKCYYINPAQVPDPEHGYVPSIVTENEPGHTPLAGDGRHAAPWYWGKTLKDAQACAAEMNERNFGLSPAETLIIVMSSMFSSQPGNQGSRRS